MLDERSLWDSISPYYLSTRYLPPKTGLALLVGGIERAVAARPDGVFEIIEVGCGAGRLMNALAVSTLQFRYLGLDFSSEMLKRIPMTLRLDSRLAVRQVDCSVACAFESNSADVVIAHWVANATRKWQEVLRNAIFALRPGGALLWFEEWGDLYSIANGRCDIEDEFLVEATRQFKQGLGNWGESQLEERVGLRMGSEAMNEFIRGYGLRIEKRRDHYHEWVTSRDYRWLADYVWLARSFSNFMRIPDDRYRVGAQKVANFLDRFPKHSKKHLGLRYSACPVVATAR